MNQNVSKGIQFIAYFRDGLIGFYAAKMAVCGHSRLIEHL